MFPLDGCAANKCLVARWRLLLGHAAWVTKHGEISIFHLFGNENADF